MAFQQLDPHELKSFLAQHPGAALLDVRSQEEWESGTISGAILLPQPLVSLKIHDVVPDVSTPVVLFCRSGGRSEYAAHVLCNLGYTQVYSLTGGMNAYSAL